MFIWNSDKTELINSDKVSGFYIGIGSCDNRVYANFSYEESDQNYVTIRECNNNNEAKKYLERIGILLQAADLS